MKVLVVGGGGREHALGWKIGQSPLVSQVFFAPGNAGTAQVGINISLDAKNIDGLLEWAVRNDINLTVVGPEAPLCAGIVDAFQTAGLQIFGPTKAAAMATEGSKAACKLLMRKYGIPTADFAIFNNPEEAHIYVGYHSAPIVIKADGLCSGKGVKVCETTGEARKFIDDLMVKRVHGDAGATVVIEQCLEGEECSVIAITDGQFIQIFDSTRDFKRLLEDNQGPNTGGMGAYSPVALTKQCRQAIMSILVKTIAVLRVEGIEYRGVLYAGLMLTAAGPQILEFNCRFGDPEIQVILPRMETDLVPLLLASLDGTVARHLPRWKTDACVCVVLASRGYPVKNDDGKAIEGLARAQRQEGVIIFHAGTREEGGKIITMGGRVVGVTALGIDLEIARAKAYEVASYIYFDGVQQRRDIGASA